MMQTVDAMMSKHTITARGPDPVHDLRRRMREHDVSALPVVGAEDVLVGLVTSSDLLAAYDPATSAETIMSAPVVTILPSTDIGDAAALMRVRRIHHLPVVDDAGQLIGIVSSWDLLDDLVETVVSLTAATVERPPVEVGDRLTDRPLHRSEPTRRGAVLEVNGPAGAPPWVVAWEDADGPCELAVVRRDEFVLDGCER